MSFGGGQGTVRYVLALDSTQAEQGLTRFKTGLTAITAPTQQVNQQMGILNNNFKATAGGLTKQNTLLAQTATQSKGLGTQVRDMTGRFSTFAIGISATTTSVLALGAGFRDYSDAQIAVDRQTRRVSLAQEALVKANEKLNKLVTSGVKSGKDYQQAQLDVAQAQSFLKTQTELLGERQETLFDTQSRFVATLAPAIIGTVGTMGAAFKDLGLNVGKIKGVFTGLGSTLSGLIPNITGIGKQAPAAATGIAAIGTASTGATGAVGGLKTALAGIGLAMSAIVALPAIGIFAGQQLNQNVKEFQVMAGKLEESWGKILKTLGLGDAEIKKIQDTIRGINETLGIHVERIDKTITADKQLADANARLTNAVTQFTKALGTAIKEDDEYWASQVKIEKAEVARLKSLTALTTVQDDFTESSTGVWKLLQEIGPAFVENTNNTQEFTNALASMGQKFIDARPESMSEFFSTLKGDIIATVDPAKEAGKAYEDAYKKGTAAADPFSVAVAKVGVNVVDAANKTEQLKKSTIDVGAAMAAGRDKFADFVKTTGEAAIENKIYHDSLLATVAAHVQLSPRVKLTTSELEQMTKTLAEGGNAAKVVADAFNKQLAPSLQTFNAAITADKWKDFKNALKDMPGFGDFSKSARKDLTGLINDFRKVSQAAKEVGTDISAAILGAFEGLSGKTLGSFTKELKKDIESIAKIDIDATKFKGITDFLDSLTKENRAAGIIKIKESLALMQDAMADGVVTAEEATSVMNQFALDTGKVVTPAQNVSKAMTEIGENNILARTIQQVTTNTEDWTKANNTVAGTINQVASNIDDYSSSNNKLARTISQIDKNTDAWAKSNNALARTISQVGKNVSSLVGDINKGARAMSQMASNIKSVTSAANTAARAIKQLASNISNLKDKTVTVKVNVVGDTEFAQHGLHKTLTHDTMIQAHAGERVDIGPTKAGGQSHSWSGGGGTGGGGNIVIENHMHVMNEDIVRKLTAKQGQNRYRFG